MAGDYTHDFSTLIPGQEHCQFVANLCYVVYLKEVCTTQEKFVSKIYGEAGEIMGQWLRMLVALAKDQGLLLSSHTVTHNCNYNSRLSNMPSWPPLIPGMNVVPIYTCKQALTLTK